MNGLRFNGRTVYAYHRHGIKEGTPTGSNPPFSWQNVIQGKPEGVGNWYARSLAGYGVIQIFAAEDNIWMTSPAGFGSIGGKARDAIYNDLNAGALGDIPWDPILSNLQAYGTIAALIVGNYIFLHYMLDIPLTIAGLTAKTARWVYNLTDKVWTRFLFENGITPIGRAAIMGIGPVFPGAVDTLIFPFEDYGIDERNINQYEYSGGSASLTFNCEDVSLLTFRTEDTDDRQLTVRRIRLQYRDRGNTTIVATFQYLEQPQSNVPGAAQTQAQTFTITGTNDGKIKVIYLDINEFTGNTITLSLGAGGNLGAIDVIKVQLITDTYDVEMV